MGIYPGHFDVRHGVLTARRMICFLRTLLVMGLLAYYMGGYITAMLLSLGINCFHLRLQLDGILELISTSYS